MQTGRRAAVSLRSALRRPFATAPAVACTVWLVYGLWLGLLLPASHGARSFIHLGSRFLAQSHSSAAIAAEAAGLTPLSTSGFDGQFSAYLALDPLHARYYMDSPAYRYTRILYPLLARLLSGGTPTLLPYALLGLNWLALGGGTLAVAAWLRRRGVAPAYALVYGFSPGLIAALLFDVSEPCAYALVALAVYLYERSSPARLCWSAAAFALAGLTRETTLFFAAAYAAALLVPQGAGGAAEAWRALRRPGWWRAAAGKAALFAAIAAGPLVAYKLVLALWLGSPGVPQGNLPQVVPFGGLLLSFPWDLREREIIRGVVAPALIWSAMAWRALARREGGVEAWALLANTLFLVVLLAPWSYTAFSVTARVTVGVGLAAVLCLPAFRRTTGDRSTWFWAGSVLWLSLTPFVLLSPGLLLGFQV